MYLNSMYHIISQCLCNHTELKFYSAHIFLLQKRDGNDGNGSKPKAKFEGGGLLPPPPGGAKLLPPPSSFQPVAAPGQ